ncbi:MAG: hypothetical protein M1815_005132 [Lichina confinis]|nr:MAG: hypothetical protein M1815_005132 [Lichina confinis]
MSRPQGRTATPLALRAPELILGDRRTKSQDIWSFGCLVFEFLTGYALLTVWDDSEGDPETIDEFFLVLSDTLGPLPSFLRSGWPNASLYYDNEGKMIKNYIGDPPSPPVFDPKTNMVEGFSLEGWFDESKPADVGPEERKEIIALLRHILQYDEKLRPSAEELLQHPWISGL